MEDLTCVSDIKTTKPPTTGTTPEPFTTTKATTKPSTTKLTTTKATTTKATTTKATTTKATTTKATTTKATTTKATTTKSTTTKATTTKATTTKATTTKATTTKATTTKATTTKATTTKATTTEATTSPPTCGRDPSATYGIKEHANGQGGCPAKLVNYSIVNAEASPVIPLDAHANHGTHLGARSFINAGTGLEKEGVVMRDAFVVRFDLCDNLSSYENPVGNDITRIGADCKSNMKWAWVSGRSNKDDFFGYSAVSPDKSYIIAAGTMQGSAKNVAHRWLVKLDANTGNKIWEIKMPSNDNRIGKFSGYESIVFTSDGGFIAGGYAKGEYESTSTVFYKSGGQVDGAMPLAEKFSAAVAATGKTSGVLSATPEWSYVCGGVGSKKCSNMRSSVNTMRVFTENGIEKIATTLRFPKSAVLTLKTADGSEDRFQQTNSNDKNQDIEVEMDTNGNVTGFVVAGLSKGLDTTSKTPTNTCTTARPCSTWEGYILKLSPDLKNEVWRQQFLSFPGGVGKYSNLPIYGGSVVYTECFSIAKIPGGYVTACGQGMEREEGGGVKGDPRGDWRGTPVAVDMDGNMMW